MSRRKTVQLKIDAALQLIKTHCRSNVVFCEKMGRSSGKWVSDWCRKPAKNLPSPEEAARMCAILQTTPEAILVEPEDIALVRGLIEQERAQQSIKKSATPEGDGLSPLDAKLMQYMMALSEGQKQFLLAQMQMLKEKESHSDDPH